MDSSCAQYPGAQGCTAPPHHGLPFTGMDVWMMILIGVVIVAAAVVLRLRDD